MRQGCCYTCLAIGGGGGISVGSRSCRTGSATTGSTGSQQSTICTFTATHFFLRVLFSFLLPCTPHPSPGNYLPPNFLSGTSDLLFLVEKRQPPEAGFWGCFWMGSPHRKLKGGKGPRRARPQDFSLTKKTARFTTGRFRPY